VTTLRNSRTTVRLTSTPSHGRATCGWAASISRRARFQARARLDHASTASYGEV